MYYHQFRAGAGYDAKNWRQLFCLINSQIRKFKAAEFTQRANLKKTGGHGCEISWVVAVARYILTKTFSEDFLFVFSGVTRPRNVNK